MYTRILSPTKEHIELCAHAIKTGKIVAFPTETVYGLGASAFDPNATKKIFEAKGRPADNPLIVHVADKSQIEEVAESIPPLAEKLIDRFMPGPLTILLKKKSVIPSEVTAGLDTVGVRMPSSEVCRKFLTACGVPVCAPSANTSTRPSPTCARHVLEDLDGKLEYILDGGECEIGLESTILDLSGDKPRLLRSGGVSIERIKAVLNCDIEMGNVKDGDKPPCPGMKYKHYSPKAEVYFSAFYNGMTKGISDLYDILEDKDKRPVILCLDTHSTVYSPRKCYNMGKSYEDYAHNLFAALRRADREGYDSVIAEGVPSDGIGAAIINRMIKSSGGKTV